MVWRRCGSRKRVGFPPAVCGLLLCFISVVLLAQDKGEAEAKAEKYAKEWRKYTDEQNGNIHVSGEVVSPTGEPLAGVKVDIDRGIAAGWEGKRLRSTETVSGRFGFVFEANHSVSLDFSLPGFHTEQTWFLFGEKAKPTRAEGENHYYDNVRVVLEKIGELARLDEYDLWLKATPDGTATVWDISGVKGTQKKPVLKEVQAQGQPAAGTVYACLVPSAVETPAAMFGDRVISRRGSVIRVGLSDGADGGFICVPLEGRPPRRAMRDMKAAPEGD
jgi:hypothetical protein